MLAFVLGDLFANAETSRWDSNGVGPALRSIRADHDRTVLEVAAAVDPREYEAPCLARLGCTPRRDLQNIFFFSLIFPSAFN